jgi:hypothetical protein
VGEWVDGGVGELMEGWVGGWMVGYVDGWRYRQRGICAFHRFIVSWTLKKSEYSASIQEILRNIEHLQNISGENIHYNRNKHIQNYTINYSVAIIQHFSETAKLAPLANWDTYQDGTS